ncbi:hypothetical protein scyTo_0008675 [Scyliorhinus torazame]|uniref:AB hydrolase-1 domain-containing protein n=1 Tax=Scyliorhinus torazame TaxID=75743 RepID=A0A401PCF1_SCYTO|nr:hypothetical protein [Scyliorhinus torazame]
MKLIRGLLKKVAYPKFYIVIEILFFSIAVHQPFSDFNQPANYLLNHTLNLYLTPEEGITVGVWFTIPDKRWQEASGKDQQWYEATLGDDNPIIIYLHGNGGSRAVGHRVELIKMLSAHGFHVLALDYRGWADSTGEPSEVGITTDSLYLFEWTRARSGKSHVCLWGHSLGTGVATNTARILHEKGSPADAIILEAPFTSMREEVAHHPFAMYYKFFPGFEWFFLDAITENNIFFHNVENLQSISTPVLILHAEDDNIIPFELGKKLYESLLDSPMLRRQVMFVAFPGFLGYKHNNIYKDPQLPDIIKDFVKAMHRY